MHFLFHISYYLGVTGTALDVAASDVIMSEDISRNGDEWTILVTNNLTTRTLKMVFTLGVPFESQAINGNRFMVNYLSIR